MMQKKTSNLRRNCMARTLKKSALQAGLSCAAFLFLLLFSVAFMSQTMRVIAADDSQAPDKRPLQVVIGVSEKDGFTRLTIDPDLQVEYEFKQNPEAPGMLTIDFDRYGIADLSALRRARAKNIYDVQISSTINDPIQLTVSFPESSRHRAFKVLRRGIVDVFEPSDPEELSEQVVAEKRSSLEEKVDTIEKERIEAALSGSENDYDDMVEEEEPRVKKDVDLRLPQDDRAQAIAEKERAELLSQMQGNPNVDANIITISSTQSFNLAAFERSGYLWVVVDNPGLKIPPTIEGPQKDLLGQPEVIEVTGGLVYRYLMPENIFIAPGGGGFKWEIGFSGEPEILTSSSVRKKYVRNGDSSLILTMKNAQTLLRVSDPDVGIDFAVVTVGAAENRVFKEMSFIDVDVVPAFIGAVLVPKSDGIRIEADETEVVIKRQGGLNIGPAVAAFVPDRQRGDARDQKAQDIPDDESVEAELSIFSLYRWNGPEAPPFNEKKNSLSVELSEAAGQRRRELLLEHIRFFMAYDMGFEGLGYIELVEVLDSNITKLPEYLALKGITLASAQRYSEALDNLATTELEKLSEVRFWEAIGLAGLQMYIEAYDTLPEDLNFLKAYPLHLRGRLLLDLAEIALQNGDVDLLQSVTDQLERDRPRLVRAQRAGLRYYRGRLAAESGLPGDVKFHLERAINSGDLEYSTRAELALVNELLRNEEITPAEALPRLERIRFAWRGDLLEIAINKRLGELYIQNGELKKGLHILRAAASLTEDEEARRDIVRLMSDAFQELFLVDADDPRALKPLEALSIYDDFKELVPAGSRGDVIINSIADKLVSVDLFSRAVDLMEQRMAGDLSEGKRPQWALKAAAISLLNRKPQKALDIMAQLDDEAYTASEEMLNRHGMLLARSSADLGQHREAISILDAIENETDEVLRLKADTGWDAQEWSYAASAFNTLVEREDILASETIDAEQAQLVLNTAISMNLAGNKEALRGLRNRYDNIMRNSPLYRSFQIVTRPMRDAVIADRDTLMSHVFEVDLFGEALDAMTSMDTDS